jgi:zinc/manganese transport system substrate-binding protein
MVLIRRQVRALATTLALGMLVITGACSSSDSDRDAASRPYLATTSIWADIASHALCGAPVEPIIPLGSDPHSWEPSIRTRGDLESAALVIANGLDLEEGLIDLLSTVESQGTKVTYIADYVDVLDGEPDTAVNHDDADADEDSHEHHDGDPHIWLDPIRVADALPAIVEAAIAAGGDESMLTDCANGYADDLRALDGDIATALADIAPIDRLLVTNHDALGYFADRYKFTIVGTVIPSTSTHAEANAADLAELAQIIDDLGIPAIFTDAQSSDVDATALAKRLDGVEIVPLLTGTLTSGTEAGATYIALLRTNAELITEALAP